MKSFNAASTKEGKINVLQEHLRQARNGLYVPKGAGNYNGFATSPQNPLAHEHGDLDREIERLKQEVAKSQKAKNHNTRTTSGSRHGEL